MGRKPRPVLTRADLWKRLDADLRGMLSDSINRPHAPLETQYVRLHLAIKTAHILKEMEDGPESQSVPAGDAEAVHAGDEVVCEVRNPSQVG